LQESRNVRKFFVLMLLALLCAGFSSTAAQDDPGVVNIYSSRHYGAMEGPFLAFQEATGIEVRVSQGTPQALLERLRAEGEHTPADLFLAIDAGVLSLAAEEGLFQPIESEVLEANIDESQRDPENRWFGLSQRVRTIVYNPETVDPAPLTGYESLADPQWQGRLCLRPASHIYTISLTSSLLYHLGEDRTREVVEGWVANSPLYIDSDQRIIETIAAGGCDVGLVNQYYLARLINDNGGEYPVALLWPNQDTTGAFYNVNGAGVTAHALNRDNAVRFLEFMSTLEGQAGTPEGFPGSNWEFPTNFAAEPNEILLSFGEVQRDFEYPLWEYGQYQQAAIDLLEAAGYGFSES
jgi:iron(III) transport system substrate-binding protein